MKKNYTVCLEYEVVESTRKKLKKGEALSPIINNLLKDWLITKTRYNRDNSSLIKVEPLNRQNSIT
jgi:hypothetical protein